MSKCKRCGDESVTLINPVIARVLLGLPYDYDISKKINYNVEDYCMVCLAKMLLHPEK